MLPDLPGWDSLPAVSRYHNWAEMAGIIAVAFLVVFEVITYQYGHRKDELTGQEQTATNSRHDEEMARLHLETANANKATEELRKQNLELEAAVAPRSLEQGNSSTALKSFAGTKVVLSAIPEFEARRFMGQLVIMFQMAQWKMEMGPADQVMDGIEIEYVAGMQRDPATGTVDFNFNAQIKVAAQALIAELNKQKIEVRDSPIPVTFAERMRPGIPNDVIRVRVGAKPMTYFLEQRFPQLREGRERTERLKKEIEDRIKNMPGPGGRCHDSG
jgi:hypothetical protein